MVNKLLESGIFSSSRVLKRYEYLAISGNKDSNIYFIKDGSLRIFIMDGIEERIVRFGYRGNIISSLDSFLSGKPSEYSIQAIKKTELLVASRKCFYEFINSDDENTKYWTVFLQDLVLQQMEREKDLLHSLPKQRFERVLNRSPRLFQEVPNKYIANYLRMSPETLSRLKKS